MIETIYNDENNNEDENIKLPKNIHQIGSGETKYHIYIEDKVSQFLELLPENEKDIRYGILLGNVKFSKGEMYMFIRSVIEVREVLENTLLFGDDVWTGIYDDIKKYYHGEKIIGWYASMEDFRKRDLFHMRKIHLDHFAGNDKVFLNINREEGEKDFYVYVNGDLQKIRCYHIYYEKNQELERYIFSTHYDLNSKKRSIRTKSEQMPERKKIESEDKIQEEPKNMEDGSQTPQEKKTEENDIYRKLMLFSGKAASVFVIGALVFTVGVMYKKGQLENLTLDMKEVVAGIMNKNDTSLLDDVMLVDDDKTSITKGWDKDTQAAQETTADTQTTAVQEETTSAPAGETIAAEETVAAVPESTTAETASILPAATQYYEVQKGDTLYGICKKLYGNTNNLEVIMKLNNLESADSITYGKTLIVP